MSIKCSKVSAAKVQVGAYDASKLSIGQFGANGVFTNPGISIFGESFQVGIMRAGVTIGPPQAIPGLTLPASLEVSGIADYFGVLNTFGVTNAFGLVTGFGGRIENGVNVKNGVDVKSAFNIGLAASNFSGPTKCNAIFTAGLIKCATIDANLGIFKEVAAPFKKFDIPHPSKPGMRLAHTCLEGPEIGVYYRGRLIGSNKIELPYYWKDLVHEDSITVQLQPIGDRHYHLSVVEFTSEYIIIKESDDKPIDCFYHVYAERKDVEKLVVEYEGDEIQ